MQNNFMHLNKGQCIYSAQSMRRHQNKWQNQKLKGLSIQLPPVWRARLNSLNGRI